MENFTGKSLSKLNEFANLYGITVESSAEDGIIETQSVLAGELLTKGMVVSVTIKTE